MMTIIWIAAAIAFYKWGYAPMVAKGYEVEVNFVAMVMTYFGLLYLGLLKALKQIEVDTIAIRAFLKELAPIITTTAESFRVFGQFIIDYVSRKK